MLKGKKKLEEVPPKADNRPLSNIDFSALLNEPAKDTEPELPIAKTAGLGELIDESYTLLRAGNFERVTLLAKRAAFMDLNSSLPLAIQKCADFWLEKKRQYNFKEANVRGDFLMESWQAFIKIVVKRLDTDVDRAIFCIKSYVFAQIVSEYERQLKLADSFELYLKLGRAYKIKGEYDMAINAYSDAVAMQKVSSQALAELADCYAIIDEEDKAKVLFREAFYHDAGEIDLALLESSLILNLKERVKALGLESEFLNEWMAVYGVVWGVFRVARELKPMEYQKLNQNIHLLRTEYTEKASKKAKPLLLYRLFWFIDYHRAVLDDKTMAEEYIKKALLEIRFIDERIYKDYRI
ncbi:MAG: hypothetical protein FWE37_00125 [Spirochaetaceae bacterium]|nr:hypothetical protein [Spirochaetaceae bacterium]